MATGRSQKGMNRKNHHDHLSNSGQGRTGSAGGTRTPKYTISDAIMGKKPPKSGIMKSALGGNTSGRKKPYKSF